MSEHINSWDETGPGRRKKFIPIEEFAAETADTGEDDEFNEDVAVGPDPKIDAGKANPVEDQLREKSHASAAHAYEKNDRLKERGRQLLEMGDNPISDEIDRSIDKAEVRNLKHATHAPMSRYGAHGKREPEPKGKHKKGGETLRKPNGRLKEE